MKKLPNPETEAEKTMELLDQIGRVEGDPWLYARIQARLAQSSAPGQVAARNWYPTLQWAMVLVCFVCSTLFVAQSVRKQEQPTASASLEQMLSARIGLEQSNDYQHLMDQQETQYE